MADGEKAKVRVIQHEKGRTVEPENERELNKYFREKGITTKQEMQFRIVKYLKKHGPTFREDLREAVVADPEAEGTFDEVLMFMIEMEKPQVTETGAGLSLTKAGEEFVKNM